MSLVTGTKLGCYEIRTQPGAVGMRGLQPRSTLLDRLVANKTSNTEFSKRFARSTCGAMAGHSEHDAGPKPGSSQLTAEQ
jgi:hypothetical protein